MSEYPFYFTVEFFSEASENPEHLLWSGLGFADSFADATRQLEDYFGDALIAIDHLELAEDCPFIMLPEEVCKKYMRDANYGNPVIKGY